MINVKKSLVMIFNTSKTRDMLPQISVDDRVLDVISSSKILGITVMDSLKWDAHVNDVTERAQRRLFIIHKLMSNGFHWEFILDVYCTVRKSGQFLSMAVFFFTLV